jgi:hypothetical protein
MKIRVEIGLAAAVAMTFFLGACSSHSLKSTPPPPAAAAQPASPAPPPAPPAAYAAPPTTYVAPPPAPVEPPAPTGDFGSGSGATYANPAIAPAPSGPAAGAPALSPAATEILRLKDAGYSEDFLLNKVRGENQHYRLTVDDLIALRRAGLSETVIDAMLHSGGASPAAVESVQPVSRHAEFDGMVRQQSGFLGIGGSKKKKIGKFVIDGDRVNWYQMIDPEDNFSITERNIKEIWLNCAPRAGENLCLEVCFKTYSGQEGCFRDAGWENGENRLSVAMYDYFQKAFPTTFFSKREKKSF